MSIVRASSKFQIAIPRQIRDRLGIHAGQRFVISDEAGTLRLIPIPEDPVEYLCGALKDLPSLTVELRAEREQDAANE